MLKTVMETQPLSDTDGLLVPDTSTQVQKSGSVGSQSPGFFVKHHCKLNSALLFVVQNVAFF